MSTISALIFCEAVADVAFQLFPLHVLAHAHVKPQHGTLSPLFLHAPDIGVLEQFPPSFEVSLKGGDKQGLAEPSRAAQEDVLAEVYMFQIYSVLSMYSIFSSMILEYVCMPAGSRFSCFFSISIFVYSPFADKVREKYLENKRNERNYLKN